MTGGSYRPELYDIVKMRKEGKEYYTVVAQWKPTKTHIKYLPDGKYEVISTGEIKTCIPQTDEEALKIKRQTLRRTFDEIRAIIRANFVNMGERGYNSQLFITLTYAENMQDTERLYKDFKKFWMRLKYHFRDQYKNLEYLAIMEPQGRGAWHIHVMVKDTKAKWVWMDKETINKLWPFGYSQTERLKSDNIGDYYTMYFTGLIAGAVNDGSEEDESGEDLYKYEQAHASSKAAIKGGRLCFYPKNFNFYRPSRGLVRPKFEKGLFYDFGEDGAYSDYKEVFVQQYDITKEIEPEEGMTEAQKEFLNKVYKATYKKRK